MSRVAATASIMLESAVYRAFPAFFRLVGSVPARLAPGRTAGGPGRGKVSQTSAPPIRHASELGATCGSSRGVLGMRTMPPARAGSVQRTAVPSWTMRLARSSAQGAVYRGWVTFPPPALSTIAMTLGWSSFAGWEQQAVEVRGVGGGLAGASLGVIHMVMQYPEMPAGPEVGTGSPTCMFVCRVTYVGSICGKG